MAKGETEGLQETPYLRLVSLLLCVFTHLARRQDTLHFVFTCKTPIYKIVNFREPLD